MFNTIVGAGAALRYGSGSDQKMRLLAAPAPQHWLLRHTDISTPPLRSKFGPVNRLTETNAFKSIFKKENI
jgi:hypothetical protein